MKFLPVLYTRILSFNWWLGGGNKPRQGYYYPDFEFQCSKHKSYRRRVNYNWLNFQLLNDWLKTVFFSLNGATDFPRHVKCQKILNFPSCFISL